MPRIYSQTRPSFGSSLLAVFFQEKQVGRGLGGTMTDDAAFPQSRVLREFRRSTRVALKVVIEAQGIGEDLTCEGETIIVNVHGALISIAVAVSVGMKIEIHVYLTGKRANAEVVYVDPEKPLRCGIALAIPQNIWGISLPPKDWHEGESG
jgi:hypothetical protein